MTGSLENPDKHYFLIRMNMENSAPGFVSTSYLGVLEEITDDGIIMSEVCTLLEAAKQYKTDKGTIDMSIDLKYYTNSMASNDKLRFPKSAVSFSRDVQDTDELMTGYKSSFDAMRLDKMNIKRVSSLHGVQPEGRV